MINHLCKWYLNFVQLCRLYAQYYFKWVIIDYSGLFLCMALNDDLPSTLTVHQVAETRSKIDCPFNNPDAILASTGRSWDDLVSATWWTVKVDGRSSFRALKMVLLCKTTASTILSDCCTPSFVCTFIDYAINKALWNLCDKIVAVEFGQGWVVKS